MKFQPRKSDLVFIGLALAVIVFLALLPTRRDNNPRVPNDLTHRQIKAETQCVACHTATGVYPWSSRHPKRQDCFRCHRAEAL